jgi:ATP-binding protein involved in chromosome partitioning
MLSAEHVLDALGTIKEHDGQHDIVQSGRISGITIKEGNIGFVLNLRPEEAHHSAALEAACERKIKQLESVKTVTIISTASAAPTRAAPTRKSEWNMEPLPYVGRIIAVASGKGGVGKSTTAVNLSHALAAQGKRVGLLDADIYGPSLPRMMALSGKPDTKDGLIIPLISHGIKCLSMGLMIEEASALVWRGPQASRALNQMLRGTAWGTAIAPLDVLLIDMPPGTGDVHLSLVQQVPVDGVIIVTTPQDVAVADARKSVDMFRKVYVSVSGIIENMSGFVDASGHHYAIFGEGGGKRLAESCHVPLLGAVPINIALREAADAGAQFSDPQGMYQDIAKRL